VKRPEWFDELVTGNGFGDIITDLGGASQRSLAQLRNLAEIRRG
jgi:isocitrate/isopropylmalate dehydrogenase